MIPYRLRKCTFNFTTNVLGYARHEPTSKYAAGLATATQSNGSIYSIPIFAWDAPPICETEPIFYTPSGTCFRGTTILSDFCTFSLKWKSIRNAQYERLKLHRHAPRLSKGTIVGMRHPITFGDWFKDGLLTLCSHPIVEPLVVPYPFVMERDYVRQYLNRLNVEIKIVNEHGLWIDSPNLLRPHAPFHHWLPKDIHALRKRFSIKSQTPRPKSLLYLSRFGVKALSQERFYPSEIIENVVESLGGKTLRSATATHDDYLSMSSEADIVIADHGSAMCNLAWWNTRRVIEVVTTWSNPYFITLASAMGVQSYHVLKLHDMSQNEMYNLIKNTLIREIS